VITAVVDAGYPLLCGLPGGGTSLDLVEAAALSGCRFLPTATEAGSVLVATTIGDVTGRAAAVTTTLGPGVTSAVNGIACAWLDRLPVLVVTDDYEPSERASYRRQNVDASRLLAPLVKASIELGDGDPEQAVRRALDLAHRAPAGPVHVTLPAATARRAAAPSGVDMAALPADAEPVLDEAALELAGDLLDRSTHPLLLVGAEARGDDAAKAVVRLAETLAAPVLTTYRGKGSLPDDHPLAAGLFTNGALERRLVAGADLLVGIGLDPVELLPRRWDVGVPFVSLRSAPAASELVQPATSVAGPLETTLDALGERCRLSPLSWTAEAAVSRRRTRAGLREAVARSPGAEGLHATSLVEIVREAAPRDTVATMDSGAHMLAVAAAWQAFEPRSFYCSSGLATMGYAVPSAIGAGLALPSRPVVAFVGDAGFLMSAPELGTLAALDATVVVVVFADAALSLIELKRDGRALPAGALATPPVDWLRLAEAFGIHAAAASSEDALGEAVAAALGRGGPSVVVARVDPSSYARISELFRGPAHLAPASAAP
jgi:acetolactate synthase-1/2/3 large subunit